MRLDEFQTDPGAPFLGFKSWNDFFIREFKSGRRPVAQPDNEKAIVSACEATPYSIQTGVNEKDTFWIKSQPYSLRDILDRNFVDQFLGGTVYQAYLSAENYHRWHSPVSGTIKMLEKVPGTYYAEAASEGFDDVGPNNSQGYIATSRPERSSSSRRTTPISGFCVSCRSAWRRSLPAYSNTTMGNR